MATFSLLIAKALLASIGVDILEAASLDIGLQPLPVAGIEQFTVHLHHDLPHLALLQQEGGELCV